MTNEELARIAMRYDTAMSRAMLRALGIDSPQRKRTQPRRKRYRPTRREVRQCFGQRYGVEGL